MKTSSFFIFCRKCVALPLFRRLSAALGLFKCFALAPPSLAVTPTIKNTHALFALCVFYLPEIRDLNGTLRKQHGALFLVPGVIATALAAQKKAYKTPAPVGLRSKSRHSDHKKHTRIICVVCFLFARNKGFERCCKLKFFCNEKPTARRGLYKVFKIIVAVEVRQAAPYFRISRGLQPHTEVSDCRT